MVAEKPSMLVTDTSKSVFNSAWSIDQIPRGIPGEIMSSAGGVWPFTVISIVCSLLDRNATRTDFASARDGYEQAKNYWQHQCTLIRNRQQQLVEMHRTFAVEPSKYADIAEKEAWQNARAKMELTRDTLDADLLALMTAETALAAFEDQWCRPSEQGAVQAFRKQHSKALAAQGKFLEAFAAAHLDGPVDDKTGQALDRMEQEVELEFEKAADQTLYPKVGLLGQGRKKYYRACLDDAEASLTRVKVKLQQQLRDAETEEERQALRQPITQCLEDLHEILKLRQELAAGSGLVKSFRELPPGAVKAVRDDAVQAGSAGVSSVQATAGITSLILNQTGAFANVASGAITAGGIVSSVGGALSIVAVIPQLFTSYLDYKDSKNDHGKASRGIAGQLASVYRASELILDHGGMLGPTQYILAPYVSVKARLAFQAKQGLNQSVSKYGKALVNGTLGVAGNLAAGATVLATIAAGGTIATFGWGALALTPLAAYLLYYYGTLGVRAGQRKNWGKDAKHLQSAALLTAQSLGLRGLKALCLREVSAPSDAELRALIWPKPEQMTRDKNTIEKVEKRLQVSRLVDKNPFLWTMFLELDLQVHALQGRPGEVCDAEIILMDVGFSREKVTALLEIYKDKPTLAEASADVQDILSKDLWGIKMYPPARLPVAVERKGPAQVAVAIEELLRRGTKARGLAATLEREALQKQMEADIEEAVAAAQLGGLGPEDVAAVKKQATENAVAKYKLKNRDIDLRTKMFDTSLDHLRRTDWASFVSGMLGARDREVLMHAFESLRRDLWSEFGIGDDDLRDLFEELAMGRQVAPKPKEGEKPVLISERVSAELVELIRNPGMLQQLPPVVAPRAALRPKQFALGLPHLKNALREVSKARGMRGTATNVRKPLQAKEMLEKDDTALADALLESLVRQLPESPTGLRVPPEFNGQVYAYLDAQLARMEEVAKTSIEWIDPAQSSAKYAIAKLHGLQGVVAHLRAYMKTLPPKIEEAARRYKDEEPVEETSKPGIRASIRKSGGERPEPGRRLSTLVPSGGQGGLPARGGKRPGTTWEWHEPAPDWSKLQLAEEHWRPMGKGFTNRRSRVGARDSRQLISVDPSRDTGGPARPAVAPEFEPARRSRTDHPRPRANSALPTPVRTPVESLSRFGRKGIPGVGKLLALQVLPADVRNKVYALDDRSGAFANWIDFWVTDDPDGVFRRYSIETGDVSIVTPEGQDFRDREEQWDGSIMEIRMVEPAPEVREQRIRDYLREVTRPRPAPGEPTLGELLETPDAQLKLKLHRALKGFVSIKSVDWSTATRSGNLVTLVLVDGVKLTVDLEGEKIVAQEDGRGEPKLFSERGKRNLAAQRKSVGPTQPGLQGPTPRGPGPLPQTPRSPTARGRGDAPGGRPLRVPRRSGLDETLLARLPGHIDRTAVTAIKEKEGGRIEYVMGGRTYTYRDRTRRQPQVPQRPQLVEELASPEAIAKAAMLKAASRHGIDLGNVDWSTVTRSGDVMRFKFQGDSVPRTLHLESGTLASDFTARAQEPRARGEPGTSQTGSGRGSMPRGGRVGTRSVVRRGSQDAGESRFRSSTPAQEEDAPLLEDRDEKRRREDSDSDD